jgi:hypothetical protein
VTARWVVDEVRPHRDLHVNWEPISLFFKNEPDPGSDAYPHYFFTHQLLRVMEAVRDEHGNQGVEQIYWEYGRRIHHDRERPFDIGDALESVGFSRELTDAADDADRWDPEIRTRMEAGLELAGHDIGTPIIACNDCYENRQAYFGPVITRVPNTEDSLKMWDALRAMMDVQGFWELKRTRTERPEFGERP